MSEHLYDEGVSTYGMKEGYRLKVTQDLDAHNFSPLTWNDEETEDGWAYRQWAAGYVYNVDVEKAKVYVNPDDDQDTVTMWEMVDCIGDCYLTPGDKSEGVTECSALWVAFEHGFEGVESYKVERITSHGSGRNLNYERRSSEFKLTIAEALDEIAPEGNSEGFNAYTNNLTGERRAEVIEKLERRGRAGFGWVDFILHKDSDHAKVTAQV